MTTDKELLKSRFGATFAKYNQLAVVQEGICDALDRLIGFHVTEPPRRGIEVGAGTGFLTRRLLDRYPHTAWTLNDLSERSATYLQPYTHGRTVQLLWGDAESLELPYGVDLVASASTVQWFDSLPQFAAQVFGVLNGGGWLVLSTFGPDNFCEIRSTTGEGLTYYTTEQLRTLFEACGFRVEYMTDYTRQMVFDTPTDVLRHIKATGVNSIRRERWTRHRMAVFETLYRERYALPDGRVPLTYHPVLIALHKV